MNWSNDKLKEDLPCALAASGTTEDNTKKKNQQMN